MKRIQLFVGLLLLTQFLFGYKLANRIVAVVGDEIILASELQNQIDFIKLQEQNPPPDSQLAEFVLDEMIRGLLLLAEAKKESIEVARSEIEQEVDKNMALLRQRFENEEQFQQALQKEGLNERILRERYRKDIRKRLITQKLLAKKGLSNINVTPVEVLKFYNEHKDSIARFPGQVAIAHILLVIKPSQDAELQAQKRISEIYDIIVRGGDFEEVAKSFSDDKVTKNKGGYLGAVNKDMLQPDIKAVVEMLKTNEISPPFRSRNGYEIIKCISRKGDKVELAHILVTVKVTRADSLQTKKTAVTLKNLIVKGASFDSLAEIYSDDPMTRDSGGYLGEFIISGLHEPFYSAIKDLKTGEISDPILSEHGYHLIKIISKQDERVLDYEEIQDQIRNYLFEQKLQEKLIDYVAEIARRTYIEKYL